MNTKLWTALLLAGTVVLTSCTDKDETTDDTAVAETLEDTGEAAVDGIPIPDPGEEYAPSRWYDDGGYHGTPETAQKMGIVLDVPSYVQGGIDPETGGHFYVFKTFEDQTDFSVSLYDRSSSIESVHIHDGTGLVFGEEVPPVQVVSPTQVRWELEGDTVYVLAVYSPGGGFF